MKQVFVVGVGRSGTSLLQSMIAAHPQVAMLPETGFFRRYCLSNRTFPFDHLGSLYDSDERLQRIPEQCWTAVAEHVTPHRDGRVSSWELYRKILSPDLAACIAGKNRSEVTLVGEKDPRLIEYLPLLFWFFPDSHFVHIVRDPRDVVASKTRAAWSAKRRWQANLAAGVFQLSLADRYSQHIRAVCYHVIRYEDLLTEPEKVLRDLVTDMGVEYDPAMLSFADAASHLSGGSIEPWKRETLGPLLPGNTGKWKQSLSARQIATTEAATRPWMRRYGYADVSAPSLRALGVRLVYNGASALYSVYRRLSHARACRGSQSQARSSLTATIQYVVDHPRSTETRIGDGGRRRSFNRLIQRVLSPAGIVGMVFYWILLLRGNTLRYDRWNEFILADHSSGVVKASLRRVHHGRNIEVRTLVVSRTQLILRLFSLYIPVFRAYLDVRPMRQAEWTAMAHLIFYIAAGRVVMERFRPRALLLSLTSDRKRIGLGLAAADKGTPIALYILDRYGVIRHVTFRPDYLFCSAGRQRRRYYQYARNIVVMPSTVRPIQPVPSRPRIGLLLNARCDVDEVRRFLEKLLSDYSYATVLVRPHPGFDVSRLHIVEGAEISDWRDPLNEFLNKIDIAFAPNSNVIIDALLHGVPTVYVYAIDPIAYDEHHFVTDGIVIPYESVTRFPDDVTDFYRSEPFVSTWNDVGYCSDPKPERNALETLLGKHQ